MNSFAMLTIPHCNSCSYHYQPWLLHDMYCTHASLILHVCITSQHTFYSHCMISLLHHVCLTSQHIFITCHSTPSQYNNTHTYICTLYYMHPPSITTCDCTINSGTGGSIASWTVYITNGHVESDQNTVLRLLFIINFIARLEFIDQTNVVNA